MTSVELVILAGDTHYTTGVHLGIRFEQKGEFKMNISIEKWDKQME